MAEVNRDVQSKCLCSSKRTQSKINDQNNSWMETAQHLLERAEKAEQTIKELQEKLSEK